MEQLSLPLFAFDRAFSFDNFAFDPSTSAAQHRAMEAAAHGKSNLGIPKKVGEEFVEADDAKVEKSSVDYSAGKGSDRCKNSVHFEKPDACEIVAGAIDPEYWCERFQMNRADPALDHRAIAFDRKSVRSFDAEGRMHIAVSNISKANVCPYLGNEIQDYDKLGLIPDKIYQLYRDPEELKKAAPTFNNIQLLIKHIPVSADDHQPDIVVGTTGSEAEFVAPYLRNSIAVWAREGIDLIESERQKELSPAYRYVADMTPGTTPDGEAFDGRMTEITGNHLCLVEEGRTGGVVVVADSAIPKLEEVFDMTKALLSRKASVAHGALMVFLKPKLAKDAKIDLGPVLTGLTHKNFAEKKASVVGGVTTLVKGKLAKDANIEGLVDLIDALQEVEPAEDEEDDENMVDPDDAGMDADPVEAMRGFLKGKMADDDVEKACAMMKPKAMDETPEEKEAREKKEKEEAEKKTAADKHAKDEEEDKKDMVKKPAMDAAIKLAEDAATKRAEANTMKRLNGIRIAERAVEPLIVKVSTALDSADAIYAAALKHA